MVDEKKGEIAHAVLGIGGFFGIGDARYMVPWNVLRYDADLGAYSSDINENRLKGRPKHGTETVFDLNARYATLHPYNNEVVDTRLSTDCLAPAEISRRVSNENHFKAPKTFITEPSGITLQDLLRSREPTIVVDDTSRAFVRFCG